MFIAIVGTEYSGRKTLQEYLHMQGFAIVGIRSPLEATLAAEPEAKADVGQGPGGLLEFSSSMELLDFATRNWTKNLVTTQLRNWVELEQFSQRPFCLVVNVDAPIMMRYSRHIHGNHEPQTIQDFVTSHDTAMYGLSSTPSSGSATPLMVLQKLSKLSILNSHHSVSEFYASLAKSNILDHDRLRPRWDTYFMMLADLAAQRSNCMKRRVGAILVRDKRIVATGYNGTPRGITNCNDGGCSRCNGSAISGTALDECLCLHAEENALLEAGRERVGKGSVLYCNTCPCLRCTVKIVQTGVSEVVYNLSYKVDAASAQVFLEAGVLLRKHMPPQ